MKLLIVDDSPNVVEGLEKGIDWEIMGFEQVFIAHSVAEARSVLADNGIDVLLCDIEMPGENGIRLLEWIKEEGLETKSILLSGYAEFEYARKAVQLGAFDYIIQPAPYEQVQAVVLKAIASIRKSRQEKELLDIGTAVSQRDINVSSYALSGYLKGGESTQNIKKLMQMGFFPSEEAPCFLILLQVVRWKSADNKWEVPLLEATLQNIIGEVFAPVSRFVEVAFIERDVFCILLWTRQEEGDMVRELEKNCRYLEKIGQKYFHFDLAFYLSGETNVYDAPIWWKKLVETKEGNVDQRGGIISGETADSGQEWGTDKVIQSIKSYIAANMDQDFRRDELAEMVHLNPDYLTKIWKKKMGITLKEYIIKKKWRRQNGCYRIRICLSA